MFSHSLLRNRRGATIVDYGILIGLLAVLSLAVLVGLGIATEFSFQRSGDTLASVQYEVENNNGSEPTSPAVDPMILVFDTSLAPGTAIDLTSHLSGSGLTINWGDGTTNGSTTHDWGVDGIYTVTIDGGITGYGSTDLTNTEDEMLIEVQAFASSLTSLENAFFGAGNNVQMPASLPASITNLDGAFYGAASFNQDISSWNVANVTSMSQMFRDALAFNQDISGWNVTSLSDASGMFRNADAFNQPIGSWSTSALGNTSQMFADTDTFNQSLATWDVSNLIIANQMFDNAAAFNQPLDAWGTDFSGVQNTDSMFQDASAFNQSLSSWDMSGVTSANSMFRGASLFDADITTWVFPGATSMTDMFRDASSFDQNLSGWCVPNIGSTPSGFDTGAVAWSAARPSWGSACP